MRQHLRKNSLCCYYSIINDMTSAKNLYLARYRMPHAIMSLQPEFTKHLIGVDRTCIASPVPKDELWTVFEQYYCGP